MGGASRQWRCRVQRARYATHDSEQPAGRMFGISSGRGNARLRSTVITGDSVGSSTVSNPPWRKRLQVAATRTRYRSPEIGMLAHVGQQVKRQLAQGHGAASLR
jgi:hypothetical protein